eukprot:SAG31_NODE_4355_length_3319_cov_1.559938_3_plen_78_part_00
MGQCTGSAATRVNFCRACARAPSCISLCVLDVSNIVNSYLAGLTAGMKRSLVARLCHTSIYLRVPDITRQASKTGPR